MSKKRYILVGGNPFTCYMGTTTFTGMSVKDSANDAYEAKKATDYWFDRCGGLLLWIDTETGKEVDL